MDDRTNNTQETGIRKITDEELKAIAGGAGEEEEVYAFGCPNCDNTRYFCYYFGSKRVAYQCERCGTRFWQDGYSKPYVVDDCD